MGVSIIVDTNAFHVKRVKDFTEVKFFYKVINLIDNIELNEYKDRVKIVFPQVVLDELVQHQIEEYSTFCNNLFECKFPGYDYTVQGMLSIEDYEKYIKKELDFEIEELKNRKIKIEKIHLDENFKLNKLLERAIKKKPPFEGKDKNSDKGFKDAVLWETLIYYKEKVVGKDEKIILYSNDNIFNQEEIFTEFNKRFNEELIVADWKQKDNDLFNQLGVLFETDSKLSKELKITTKFRESINKSIILDLLNKINFKEDMKNQIFKTIEIISMEIEEIGDVTIFENEENKSLFRFNVSLNLLIRMINEEKYDYIDLTLAWLHETCIVTNKDIDIEVFYDNDEELIYIGTVFINGILSIINPIYL